ncbi:hypothetical protein BDV96DRAFT_661082 [Lophiotrema nucula]|uniref:Uncharacterized protein n=1 Tax=Lophiotrema nucula TaxID=690887 RepID=A0A6A5Z7A6_9PLEO|nr:hypothetical protein BDV96DRAFT_661082 [Lophiotrema nucula]
MSSLAAPSSAAKGDISSLCYRSLLGSSIVHDAQPEEPPGPTQSHCGAGSAIEIVSRGCDLDVGPQLPGKAGGLSSGGQMRWRLSQSHTHEGAMASEIEHRERLHRLSHQQAHRHAQVLAKRDGLTRVWTPGARRSGCVLMRQQITGPSRTARLGELRRRPEACDDAVERIPYPPAPRARVATLQLTSQPDAHAAPGLSAPSLCSFEPCTPPSVALAARWSHPLSAAANCCRCGGSEVFGVEGAMREAGDRALSLMRPRTAINQSSDIVVPMPGLFLATTVEPGWESRLCALLEMVVEMGGQWPRCGGDHMTGMARQGAAMDRFRRIWMNATCKKSSRCTRWQRQGHGMNNIKVF